MVIASMQRDINPLEARRLMDGSGLIVAPGLIDFHAHAFLEAKQSGPETDPTCLPSGVTTLADKENLKPNGKSFLGNKRIRGKKAWIKPKRRRSGLPGNKV